MKSLNIMGSAKLWLLVSLSLVVISTVLTFTLAFTPKFKAQFPFIGIDCPTVCGIDFNGGTLIELQATQASNEQLRNDLAEIGYEAIVQQSEGDAYFIRFERVTEEQHQQVISALTVKYPDLIENRYDSVGPVIGQQLSKKASIAVLLLLAGIGVYIAWAFRRVSEPVASWKYGVVTLLTAFHDVIIPVGVFAVLGKFFGYQIDIAFVAAMLTILGYSINDTIVVLDRTRENLARHRHAAKPFGEILNMSINETIGRSLNTTLTTLLPLVAIFAVGGATTRPFVLALILGILAGAYSSIFFASPLLLLWDRWSHRAK